MIERYEIRFSGSGGQGMILAGIIMAEAASIFGNKNAAQSQSYGPESRGGASRAEVIIADAGVDIDYPKATAIDCMLALTQTACTSYYSDIKKDGILLIDEDEVTDIPEGDFKVVKYPILRAAREDIGKSIVGNIISLGMIAELTGIVSREEMENAVLSRVPKPFLELNKSALALGFEKARELKKAL
jgi:2-oxoglutarate ferredoxin oxidoreductase subunit gamma